MRAVIYARISRDTLGQGAGVERQEEACRHLAAARGWDVIAVLTDNDLSAYSGVRRPDYERLTALMRSGQIDAVLVWHMDRLCRRLVDLVERPMPRTTVAATGPGDGA